MKALEKQQISKLFTKRRNYMIGMRDLAEILNCRIEHITDAHVGKPVPDDVYEAITDWAR